MFCLFAMRSRSSEKKMQVLFFSGACTRPNEIESVVLPTRDFRLRLVWKLPLFRQLQHLQALTDRCSSNYAKKQNNESVKKYATKRTATSIIYALSILLLLQVNLLNATVCFQSRATRLYKQLFVWLVSRSVGWSVGQSVGRSVVWSVHHKTI